LSKAVNYFDFVSDNIKFAEELAISAISGLNHETLNILVNADDRH